MRRQSHVPVLKQSLQSKPRQIGRRKTALLSQSFKLRTLRRRQAELKTRGVGHAHTRRQSDAGCNALCCDARAQLTFAFSQAVDDETDWRLW
jgi:hypothetical protein